MDFSNEQIIPFVHNALRTETDPQERLRFLRFTPEQTADYGLDGEGFPIRCRASANVTLDFITDSDWLAIQYDVQIASSRSFYGMDLFVDGSLHDSRIWEGFSSSEVLFDLPEGTHRITLFFPWSAEVMLRRFALSDGASACPVPPKKLRILMIGDSITQGYVAMHPGFTWAGEITRGLDAEVLNLGVGGYGFNINSLNHRIEWQPHLIILAYGTNDYMGQESGAGYRQNAFAYMDGLTRMFPETPILQALPIYRHDEKFVCLEKIRTYTFEDARRILRETAAAFPQVTVMESGYFPHSADYFAPDYLHPNDLGFRIMGERLAKEIRQMEFLLTYRHASE